MKKDSFAIAFASIVFTAAYWIVLADAFFK
jgi:hypothetical protein